MEHSEARSPRSPVPAATSLAFPALVLSLTVGCSDRAARPGTAGGGGTDDGVAPAAAWMTEVATELGIDVRNELAAPGAFQLPEIMGGGVALFDCDGDGDLDVYFVRSGPAPAEGTEAARNRLFVQSADGTFRDGTERSGLGDEGYGMGCAVGDVDRDGDLDVYVTNLGPDRLFVNDGTGAFEDVSATVGADVDGWSCSAAFFDYDLDGWLDLFVTRYVQFDAQRSCNGFSGRRDYCGPKEFTPLADVLLQNRRGTFVDRSEAAGIRDVAAAGLGVVSFDANEDGLPDVYVANDAYANHLWINTGGGTFREEALQRGAAYNLEGRPEAGMGVVAADFDGDLAFELFVTHLRGESNTLYAPRGAGDFRDASGRSGLGRASMPWTGFGTAAFDLELDGDLDLFVANGRVTWAEPVAAAAGAGVPVPWDGFVEPDALFRNGGGGVFQESAGAAGLAGEPVAISRGAALGDIDADGDLDLVVTSLGSRARVYRNDAPRAGHWLAVRARDADGVELLGAAVRVRSGGRAWAALQVRASGYLSSHAPHARFGLGACARYESVEVTWPDGKRERFAGGDADRIVELVRGEGITP